MMGRAGAIAFIIAVTLAVLSCAAPATTDPAASVPEAQATAVRRAAIADVQRIIAGNLVPTATPGPTATQAPSCPSALWWYEARDHVGESRVIQGPVVRTRPGPTGSLWLEIGQPYPDPIGLPVLVRAGAGANLAG